MLKVKLNKNITKETDLLYLNELQIHDGRVLFPFYENSNKIQAVELIKEGEWYKLHLFGATINLDNKDKIMVKEELCPKDIVEGLEEFLKFNSNLISEYERGSLLNYINYSIDNNVYKYIYPEVNIVEGEQTVVLDAKLSSATSILFNVKTTEYSLDLTGSIIDIETDKAIGDITIESSIPYITGEHTSVDDIIGIFESMSQSELFEKIKSSVIDCKTDIEENKVI